MSGSPVDLPDERLVDGARQRDKASCRALFERYRDVAFRVAVRVTRHEADAMDVVQDSFIKAFGSLDRLDDGTRFKAWLLRIVHNRALDLLRSRKIRMAVSIESNDEERAAMALPADPAVSDPARVGDGDVSDRIGSAIESLPADQRSVLALYLSGTLTYAEIADLLDVPIGTVMSRLYRARRQLAEWLPDLAPPESKRNEEA